MFTLREDNIQCFLTSRRVDGYEKAAAFGSNTQTSEGYLNYLYKPTSDPVPVMPPNY